MSLKKRFLTEYLNKSTAAPIKILIVVLLLPSGATEVITNTSHIDTKMAYYNTAYNEEMQLNANPLICIKGWVII